MFYIGIDIAKHKHEASIIDSDGSLLCESISFSNSQKGCEKLIALLERFSVNPDNCIVGMEATGHYWLSIYSYLFELGFDLKVINPIQSDAFRKFISVKQRTTPKIRLLSLKLCVSVSFRHLHYLMKISWLFASFQDTDFVWLTTVPI